MTRFSFVATAGCLLLIASGLAGQDIRTNSFHLNGTWLITVARLDAAGTPVVFNTLQTFLPDGTVLQSSGISLRNRGTAHGYWMATGDREFLTTMWILRFDPATDQFLGFTRVTQRIRLNESMDEYKASAYNQVLDAQGKPSAPALIGTETARRLPVVHVPELPAPPQ